MPWQSSKALGVSVPRVNGEHSFFLAALGKSGPSPSGSRLGKSGPCGGRGSEAKIPPPPRPWETGVKAPGPKAPASPPMAGLGGANAPGESIPGFWAPASWAISARPSKAPAITLSAVRHRAMVRAPVQIFRLLPGKIGHPRGNLELFGTIRVFRE